MNLLILMPWRETWLAGQDERQKYENENHTLGRISRQ